MGSRQGLTLEPRVGVLLAAGVYGAWTLLLFSPHLAGLRSNFRLLYALNPIVGAVGIYLLSRRWLAGWMPSMLAGLFYGFGPFGLSFLGFHPLTGLTFAGVPWLFLPAIYWHHGRPPTVWRFCGRALLCVLPFAFVIVFFWTFSQHWAGRLFLLPKNAVLSGNDFTGLVFPLSRAGNPVVLGAYHFGLAAALMGLFVYVTAQRVTVLIPPAIGLVLAFLSPIWGISPVIWAAMPMVFWAILAGLGAQCLLWAGKNDAKWVLLAVFSALCGTGIALLLFFPNRSEHLLLAVLMYGCSAASLGLIFLLSLSGLRWLFIRWVVIAAMAAADCYLSGRWLVDRLM